MMRVIEFYKKKGVIKGSLYLINSLLYAIISPVIYAIFRVFSIKKQRCLFVSYPTYSDNAKVFYEYLYNKCKGSYEYVWLLHDGIYDKSLDSKDDTKVAYIYSKMHAGYSYLAIFYLSTSSVIFCTHGTPCKYKKRNCQTIINLWHGCGYKDGESKEKEASFDYGLVPGDIFIPIKARQWHCSPAKILPIGYPRYDLLINSKKKEEIDLSCLKPNIKTYDKTVIWMPTFRQSIKGSYKEESLVTDTGLPLLESFDRLISINERFRRMSVLLIVKRHPSQKKYPCEGINYSNICFVSNDDLLANNIELYTMLNKCDALITDYSSIGVDFLITGKPVAYVLNDADEYKKCRGFVFDDYEHYMAGEKIYNEEDFAHFICDVTLENDRFSEQRKVIKTELINECNCYSEKLMNFLSSNNIL